MLSTLALVSALLGQQPVCAPGQVAAPKSGGKCCFPGQTWSAKESRCAGKPQCPAGMTVAGEECVELAPSDPSSFNSFPGSKPVPAPVPAPTSPPPAMVPPPPAPAPYQPPPQYVPQQQPSHWEDGVLVPYGYHLEKQPRGGMYGAGIGAFSGGFVFSVFSSLLALVDYNLSRNPCANFAATTNWIPLAGPIINVAGQRAIYGFTCTGRTPLYEFGVFISVVETLAQAAGITLFVLGFALPEKVAVPDERPPRAQTVQLDLGLGAPGSATGVSATLRW